MNNSYITIIKEKRTALSRKRIPLNQNGCTANFRIGVPFEQNLHDFLDVLEEGFKEFFEKEVPGNPQKAEYLIPIFIGELLAEDKMSVKVLRTNDTWYGMTYKEDVAVVKESFRGMLERGVYKEELFCDIK